MLGETQVSISTNHSVNFSGGIRSKFSKQKVAVQVSSKREKINANTVTF
jgi:hypothetical protein